MRVPLDWLGEIVDLPVDEAALAARLTDAGFEVEQIDRLEVPDRVVAGAILEVRPLGEQAGLSVCRVAVGDGAPLEIVCGAPGVASGQLVPVALPGAALPGGAVAEREVRGVRSAAVLCSERDLGLSDDHAGLLELKPADLGSAGSPKPPAPGTSLRALLSPQVVLDLAVSPNRGDCASILGVAREVAAHFGVKMRARRPSTPVADEETESLAVAIEAHDLCSWYCAQRFHAPTVERAPLWLRRRLLACGVRPISPAVDVTNYVMLERGQPLHAFDLDRLRGARLVARRARPGEELRLLDGRDVRLEAEDLAIADAEGAVALAGVMGGANSEVGSGTGRIALESAIFLPAAVRRTARRLGLHSEASFRFERGVDPAGAAAAVERAASLLAGLGGRPIGRLLEAGGPAPPASAIPVVPKRLNALLGTSVEPQEIVRRLRAIGASVKRTHGETIEVTPPSHRLDLRQPADLAEEVARVGGYAAIPTTRPRIVAQGRTGHARGLRRLQQAFAGQGLFEAVLLAFTDPADNRRFPGLWSEADRALEPRNPLASLARELRRSLLPGLLAALRVNQSQGEEFVPIFAVGTVFAADADDQPRERIDAAALIYGFPPAGIGRTVAPLEFLDVKHIVGRVLGEAGVGPLEWRALRDVFFLHPGKAAEIRSAGRRLGRFGAAHPSIAAELDLRAGDLWLVELDAHALLASRPGTARYLAAPRFPAVERDVALVVDEDVEAGQIVDSIRAQRDPLVENVVLFDEYKGAGVPPGRKSLAYRISYRAAERTLTDAEVNLAHENLLRRLSATLRFERRGAASEVKS